MRFCPPRAVQPKGEDEDVVQHPGLVERCRVGIHKASGKQKREHRSGCDHPKVAQANRDVVVNRGHEQDSSDDVDQVGPDCVSHPYFLRLARTEDERAMEACYERERQLHKDKGDRGESFPLPSEEARTTKPQTCHDKHSKIKGQEEEAAQEEGQPGVIECPLEWHVLLQTLRKIIPDHHLQHEGERKGCHHTERQQHLPVQLQPELLLGLGLVEPDVPLPIQLTSPSH
mmetsp:Transcript_93300/g.234452  ORF Transcript_93300/g.234452 Transcript_93300/m.234452 type:complete len:229 (+) Transcript_93300:565-1251(+)